MIIGKKIEPLENIVPIMEIRGILTGYASKKHQFAGPGIVDVGSGIDKALTHPPKSA